MDRFIHTLFVLLLAAGLLFSAAGTLEFRAVHLALLYVLFSVCAFIQYDYYRTEGLSTLLSVQILLTFLLSFALTWQMVIGFGSRFSLAGLLVLVLAFLLLRDDAVTYLKTAAPYVAGFAVLTAVFFFAHVVDVPIGSGRATFPILAGLMLGMNLFVVPRYASETIFFRTTALLAATVAGLGVWSLAAGEYTFWFLEVGTWRGTVSPPLIDRELPIVQSIFTNPNTLGVVLFAGTVSALVEVHRAVERRTPIGAGIFGLALMINVLGLYFSNSRASMAAAAFSAGLYAGYVALGRRAVPALAFALLGAFVTLLAAMYVGLLDIDSANRFALWSASVEAIRDGPLLFGAGIVDTGEAIAPYAPEGARGASTHNSYLSIVIRAGLVGGIAYALLVVGSVVHGLARADRVNIALVTLAAGFAVHQLFEAYTLFHFNPGAILGALTVGYLLADLASPPDRVHGLPSAAPAVERHGRETRTDDRPLERPPT